MQLSSARAWEGDQEELLLDVRLLAVSKKILVVCNCDTWGKSQQGTMSIVCIFPTPADLSFDFFFYTCCLHFFPYCSVFV